MKKISEGFALFPQQGSALYLLGELQAPQNALKKLKSTLGAIQINNFMKNAKATITKIVML